MEQFRLPKIAMPELKLPQSVQEVLAEAETKLAHRPKLLRLFKNCFPNTLETTTKLMEDGTTFVITGDIPAMWLRDSVEQVIQYVPFAKEDAELQRIISGLIKLHMRNIQIDPYANAFNEMANDWHWNTDDITEMSPWVWERKFELDSICFSMRLAFSYWKETGRADIFVSDFKKAMRTAVDLWRREQHHFEHSPYRFERDNGIMTDSLMNGGLGMPVNYTGMVWSGFRPSDDACDFHYNIPDNMSPSLPCARCGRSRSSSSATFRSRKRWPSSSGKSTMAFNCTASIATPNSGRSMLTRPTVSAIIA